MQYFIDIGNTRIKHTCNDDELVVLSCSREQISEICASIKEHNSKEIILTAGRSEASQRAKHYIKNYAAIHNIDTKEITIDDTLLKVNYEDTSQFGVDRYLNLLAARQQFQKNFCVVSCGTAITLDFYTNIHIGGMITLGLGSAKQVLQNKTGLSQIELPTQALGNNTSSCIGVGLYFGYRNLIIESIKNIEKQLNLSFQVIYTGGDAEVLSNEDTIVPSLLFKGMKIYLTKDS
ncbi:MAG: type III pantothenate kinase [Gammaproteobacteria bacterium]|nr:type III pantothenate kinase [Gammaproteobacteria bacterium]